MESNRLHAWLRERGWLEPGAFLSRPSGALLLTLACAALLLGLGYQAGQEELGAGLETGRRELAEQTTRANRLAQENEQLEARLALALAQLEARAGQGQAPEDGSREGPGVPGRVLHQSETLVLLEGRVSLTLQAILSSPRRAQLRLKTPGAQEVEAALRPGQDLRFRLGRQSWLLTLGKIHASSVSFSMQVLGE